MIEVPAAMTNSTTFASVASGATTSAAGGISKPAITLTLSLTISSCASRFVFAGHAGGVAQDDLNLFAGNRVAVFLHVKVDGGLDLFACRGLLTGHRHYEADFDRVLREGAACSEDAENE